MVSDVKLLESGLSLRVALFQDTSYIEV